MVTSIATPDSPFGCDGCTYEANAWRTLVVSGLTTMTGSAQVYSGVLAGGGSMQVTAPGGMSVQQATGYCVIASSSASTYGGYITGLYTSGALTVATSDPTNPRIDVVCVTVTDEGSSSSAAQVQIITGTPASSPSAPAIPNATPNSSLALAQITVPAGATSILSSNITDVRIYTTANGGIIPVPSVTGTVPAGHNGMYIHDRATNRLWHNPTAGPTQPLVLPWAPVVAAFTSAKGSVTNQVTLLSASFTSNGGDVKLTADWAAIYGNGHASSGTPQPFRCMMTFAIDGTQVQAWFVANAFDDGNYRGGGSFPYSTSSVTGDTPASGNHTATWTMTPYYDGTHDVYVQAAANSPAVLRVEPVSL